MPPATARHPAHPDRVVRAGRDHRECRAGAAIEMPLFTPLSWPSTVPSADPTQEMPCCPVCLDCDRAEVRARGPPGAGYPTDDLPCPTSTQCYTAAAGCVTNGAEGYMGRSVNDGGERRRPPRTRITAPWTTFGSMVPLPTVSTSRPGLARAGSIRTAGGTIGTTMDHRASKEELRRRGLELQAALPEPGRWSARWHHWRRRSSDAEDVAHGAVDLALAGGIWGLLLAVPAAIVWLVRRLRDRTA